MPYAPALHNSLLMPEGPALVFEDLSFTYRRGGDPALREIDLGVAEGEVLAVLGRSGAGKTTLCSAVNGIVPRLLPGELRGEVRIRGEVVAGRSVASWADTVGVLFQDFESQLFCTQARLEVAFGPENLGVPPEEIGSRVAECLRWAGLEHLAERNPAHLSGGEKQRLVLASVLALRPRIVVLDEPTTDLDPAAREEVFRLARELARTGRTLLVAEHEPEALRFADRALVLSSGRIRRHGGARELRGDPDWLTSRGLAADPVARIWQGLGLEGRAPSSAAEAGLELRRREARLGPLREGRTAGPPLLEARALDVVYPGGVEALRGVDLVVREGETSVIVGPNGSGKTTLARVLAGLQSATRGEVRHRGELLQGPRAAVGRVGLVFQEPDDQIFSETVWDEVTFAPRTLGMPEEEVRRRGREALDAVGLSGREEEDPFILPKGERQKVAVASVLATGPEVLVLDEPTTGLDHGDLHGMLAMVRRLRDRGRGVVMITHAMEVAAAEADRVVVLAQGQVRAQGPPREIFADASLLREARLRPPAVVEVCAALDGPAALTVEELTRRLVLRPHHGRPRLEET